MCFAYQEKAAADEIAVRPVYSPEQNGGINADERYFFDKGKFFENLRIFLCNQKEEKMA